MKNLYAFLLLSLLGLSVAKSQTGPECLIAKYYFDQGNANDDLGNYHGTAVGATLVPNRFGVPNAAYYLNGTPGSYLNLGTANAMKPQALSVSMWVKIAAPVYAGSGYMYNPILLTKCQPGNNCFEAYCLYYKFQTNEIITGCTQLFCTQPSVYSSTTAVALNTWHHLVVAYDFNTIYLYVDGVQQGSVAKGFTQTFLAGDSIMIGNSANVPQNNRFFNGTIDDIRFYNCVLTQNEVNVLYNENNPSGIAESNVSSLSIYPNPASDIVNLSEYTDVLVTDMLGNEVMKICNTNTFDISALPAGVYVVTCSRKEGILRRERLVKK